MCLEKQTRHWEEFMQVMFSSNYNAYAICICHRMPLHQLNLLPQMAGCWEVLISVHLLASTAPPSTTWIETGNGRQKKCGGEGSVELELRRVGGEQRIWHVIGKGGQHLACYLGRQDFWDCSASSMDKEIIISGLLFELGL